MDGNGGVATGGNILNVNGYGGETGQDDTADAKTYLDSQPRDCYGGKGGGPGMAGGTTGGSGGNAFGSSYSGSKGQKGFLKIYSGN